MIDHVAYHILAHAAAATSSSEQATAVLNVFPKSRSPLVLAAVLSRGFLEFRPELAVKHGHMQLLPHFPTYVLFDGLDHTLAAAGARGDISTIELLWRLAGPATPGHLTWFEKNNGLLAAAIKSNHAPVLEWFSNIALATNNDVNWTMQAAWDRAAEVGNTSVIRWAIARGHLKELACVDAFLSIRHGDHSVIDWWIAQQPSKETVLAALNDVHLLVKVSAQGVVGALDWWWAYTGAKLPDPDAFAEIANAALTSRSLAGVAWWWSRFVEHRTPRHKFGTLSEIGQFNTVDILDWYYNESMGLDFTFKSRTSLPILQWVVTKCTELGGQKVVLSAGFINACAMGGHVDILDLVLRSANVLDVEWPPTLVREAVWGGRTKLLEWWDRNRDELPPQDLKNRAQSLVSAAGWDAADVLAWWHARRFPVTKKDWQKVCAKAIISNASRVQLWLRDHPALFAPTSATDRRQFMDDCIDGLQPARPFTLDFVAAIHPNQDSVALSPLPIPAYTSMAATVWFSSRANVTVASLLPLSPRIFSELLQVSDTAVLEWWLQAHLAAGHRVVLPAAEELDEIFLNVEESHKWVYNVAVTRKIKVFTESGTEPYEPEHPWYQE